MSKKMKKFELEWYEDFLKIKFWRNFWNSLINGPFTDLITHWRKGPIQKPQALFCSPESKEAPPTTEMKVKFVGNAQSDTKFLQPSYFQLLLWKLMFTVEPILWFERLYISLVEATMLHSVIQLGRGPKHPKPNRVIFVEWMDVDLVALEEMFVQFGSCMRLYKSCELDKARHGKCNICRHTWQMHGSRIDSNSGFASNPCHRASRSCGKTCPRPWSLWMLQWTELQRFWCHILRILPSWIWIVDTIELSWTSSEWNHELFTSNTHEAVAEVSRIGSL